MMNDKVSETVINTETIKAYIQYEIDQREIHHKSQVNKQNIHVSVIQMVDTDNLLIRLSQKITALPDEDIVIDLRQPKTWWDHFKEKWYPSWAIKRWPIEYNEIYIREKRYKAICPHLGTHPTNDHLEWILRQRKGL